MKMHEFVTTDITQSQVYVLCGDEKNSKIFINKNAFINLHNYESFVIFQSNRFQEKNQESFVVFFLIKS